MNYVDEKLMHFSEEMTKQAFLTAYNLIKDPSHWTQDTWARNEADKEVDYNSPDAVKWCSMGAFKKAAHNMSYEHYFKGRKILSGIVQINDDNDHATVMKEWERIGKERGWL